MSQSSLRPINFANRAVDRQFRVFGRLIRLMVRSLSVPSVRALDREKFRFYFWMLGMRSFPLIAISSILVSLALTTQTVLEALAFNFQDLSGPALAIGLLRELAGLTVGLAWAARGSAFLTDHAFRYHMRADDAVSHQFITPAYLAAIASAIPLSGYGLVIGFGTAALFAPFLGVSSTSDFLESARQQIVDKDITVYFLKLVIVNPTVMMMATLLVLLNARDRQRTAFAWVISYTCIGQFLANLAVTWAWYMP